MSNTIGTAFESAVRSLVAHVEPADENSRKPLLFHDIRVGVYLYESGYADDLVIAGVLHDAIEWSDITAEMLAEEFGTPVRDIVLACTMDDSITDKYEKTNALIQQCVKYGQDALVVKAADILDSFKWYAHQENEEQLKYCVRNANAIFRLKPNEFNDKIFSELSSWLNKFKHLGE